MKQFLFITLFAFGTKFMLANSVYQNVINQIEKQTLPLFELKRVGNEFAAFKYNATGNISEYYLIQGSTWNISEATITQAVYTEGTEIRLFGSNDLIYVFSILEYGITNVGNLRKTHASGIAHYTILNSNGITLSQAETLAFSNAGGGGPNPTLLGCESACLSGGCSSSSCSRELFGGACSVSCDAESFACCGDLLTYGCKCVPKACCAGKN